MSEVVGWESVSFDKNNVVLSFGGGAEVPHDEVVVFVVFWLRFEAKGDAWLPFRAGGGAVVAVKKGLLVGGSILTIGIDSCGGRGVGVGATLFDELPSTFVIEGEAFSLEVGGVWATDDWAFVPVEAEPFKRIFNESGGIFDITLAVSIFDS